MITVNRIGKHLGAEISGVDLSKPLDDDTFAQVAKAFFDNEVAFFRNQKLTPEQQIAFTRRFGVLEQHVRKESRLQGHPEILIISNLLDENGNAIGSQDAGRFWHSDLSYKKEPSMLSALYSLEVPVKDGRVLGDTSRSRHAAAA
jgi:taurine dioxygenase